MSAMSHLRPDSIQPSKKPSPSFGIMEDSGRWVVLFLSCFISFGSFFCFDIPSILEADLSRHFKDTHHFDAFTSMMYAVYSIPNMVIPIIGGILLDTKNKKTVTLSLSVLVAIGMGVQCLACYWKSSWLLLGGRFVFALGSETLVVATQVILTVWFESYELAFALGFNLALSRLGNIASIFLIPALNHEYGITVTFLAGLLTCCMSVLCCVAMVRVGSWSCSDVSTDDKREGSLLGDENGDNQVADEESPPTSSLFLPIPPRGGTAMGREQGMELCDVESSYNYQIASTQPSRNQQPHSFPYLEAARQEEHYRRSHSNEASYGSIGDVYSRDHADSNDRDNSMDSVTSETSIFQRSNKKLWFVFAIGFFVYGSIGPFANIANVIILDRFFPRTDDVTLQGQYAESAIDMQVVPFVVSAMLSPILGLLIDYAGHRTLLIIVSPVLITMSHLMIAQATYGPYLPLALLGISYSLFVSVLWPSIPLVTDSPAQNGLAFGTLTALLNLSEFVVPLVVGGLYVASNYDYTTPLLFFALFSAVGVIIAVLLWYDDEKNNGSKLRLSRNSAICRGGKIPRRQLELQGVQQVEDHSSSGNNGSGAAALGLDYNSSSTDDSGYNHSYRKSAGYGVSERTSLLSNSAVEVGGPGDWDSDPSTYSMHVASAEADSPSRSSSALSSMGTASGSGHSGSGNNLMERSPTKTSPSGSVATKFMPIPIPLPAVSSAPTPIPNPSGRATTDSHTTASRANEGKIQGTIAGGSAFNQTSETPAANAMKRTTGEGKLDKLLKSKGGELKRAPSEDEDDYAMGVGLDTSPENSPPDHSPIMDGMISGNEESACVKKTATGDTINSGGDLGNSGREWECSGSSGKENSSNNRKDSMSDEEEVDAEEYAAFLELCEADEKARQQEALLLCSDGLMPLSSLFQTDLAPTKYRQRSVKLPHSPSKSFLVHKRSFSKDKRGNSSSEDVAAFGEISQRVGGHGSCEQVVLLDGTTVIKSKSGEFILENASEGALKKLPNGETSMQVARLAPLQTSFAAAGDENVGLVISCDSTTESHITAAWDADTSSSAMRACEQPVLVGVEAANAPKSLLSLGMSSAPTAGSSASADIIRNATSSNIKTISRKASRQGLDLNYSATPKQGWSFATLSERFDNEAKANAELEKVELEGASEAANDSSNVRSSDNKSGIGTEGSMSDQKDTSSRDNEVNPSHDNATDGSLAGGRVPSEDSNNCGSYESTASTSASDRNLRKRSGSGDYAKIPISPTAFSGAAFFNKSAITAAVNGNSIAGVNNNNTAAAANAPPASSWIESFLHTIVAPFAGSSYASPSSSLQNMSSSQQTAHMARLDNAYLPQHHHFSTEFYTYTPSAAAALVNAENMDLRKYAMVFNAVKDALFDERGVGKKRRLVPAKPVMQISSNAAAASGIAASEAVAATVSSSASIGSAGSAGSSAGLSSVMIPGAGSGSLGKSAGGLPLGGGSLLSQMYRQQQLEKDQAAAHKEQSQLATTPTSSSLRSSQGNLFLSLPASPISPLSSAKGGGSGSFGSVSGRGIASVGEGSGMRPFPAGVMGGMGLDRRLSGGQSALLSSSSTNSSAGMMLPPAVPVAINRAMTASPTAAQPSPAAIAAAFAALIPVSIDDFDRVREKLRLDGFREHLIRNPNPKAGFYRGKSNPVGSAPGSGMHQFGKLKRRSALVF